MAGAGAKLFTDGSVLNAAQVNTYLMDQSIMRFATTAARDAAFGGAGEPAVAEGMTCYIDADNTIYTYDGSSWIGVASASTTANVSSGLVYLGSGTTAGTINELRLATAFSATYEHYLLQLTVRRTSLTADETLYAQVYSGGTIINTSATYAYASEQRYLTTQSNAGSNTDASIPLGRFSNYESVFNITINSPQVSTIATQIHSYNVNVQNGFTVDGNRCVGIRRAEETNEGIFFYATVNFVSSWVLFGYRK